MSKKLMPLINFFILVSLFSQGCDNRSQPGKINSTSNPVNIENPEKIGKVIFFLENSESMFGYVKGLTKYVEVVSELAEKREFADERTSREFFFVNGGDNVVITPVGYEPSVLRNKLNIVGFRCGDITQSNLNAMLQIALEKAKEDTITILISDAIYDLDGQTVPLSALKIAGLETRRRFIERLGEKGDLQTLMIKLYSQFNGNFFPVTGGRISINQTRPFYIWIFGKTNLLNKYFTEDYIRSLEGFSEMSRFLNFENLEFPYQIIPLERIGDYKFDKTNKNKLVNAKPRHTKFQFSFAVDLDSMPFSDSYKEKVENYSINGNYTIVDVKKNNQKLFGIPFTPSHLITVATDKSPYNSELKVILKNVTPQWIFETHTLDESNIQNDTTHTVGFQFLTDGIIEAYEFVNREKNLATFTFEITN